MPFPVAETSTPFPERSAAFAEPPPFSGEAPERSRKFPYDSPYDSTYDSGYHSGYDSGYSKLSFYILLVIIISHREYYLRNAGGRVGA